MATQLKSKPKPSVKAAAARRTKKAPPKKVTTPKKPTTPKVTQPAGRTSAGVSAPTGVYSNSTGSLISPGNWKADQAKLQSSWEDAENVADLDAADSKDALDYQARKDELARDAEKARLQLDQDRQNMRKQAVSEKASLDSSLAYRGASRGSAGIRQRANLTNEIAKAEGDFTAADSNITTEKVAAEGTLGANLSAAQAARAAKRKLIAERAAAQGVYSSGSAPVSDTGVSAPGLETPYTTPKPPKPKPVAAPKPKKKAAVTAAAKRKVASKKKGKK